MTERSCSDRNGASPTSDLSRRRCVTLVGSAIAATAIALPLRAFAAADAPRRPTIVVHKSPSCGCCGAWAAYMQRHGFKVIIKNTDDIDVVKRTFGVPENLGACHTATVGGYVVEGHVPASSVIKLLAERPKARGIVVPGMPMGTPGMGGDGAGPVGVLLFGKNGVIRRYDVD